MQDYTYLKLNQEIIVDSLVTVHYFEYSADFYFPGEIHNFWEFLYVDKGVVEVTGGDCVYHLKKGDIIFHKPLEFHSLRANGATAPNLVVVSFSCNSPAMDFFNGKIMRVGDFERNLMAKILEEANSCFDCAMDDPDLRQLVRSPEQKFAAEQIIKLSLELLLIHFIREGNVSGSGATISSSIKEKAEDLAFEQIISYLENNIGKNITLDDICRDNLLGRSYLQRIFREKSGGGVMEYFGSIRIEAAKRQIREGSKNFTEIANDLGYSSIHYFSRHFKKICGMTPTEYASSVKIRSEKQINRPIFIYD